MAVLADVDIDFRLVGQGDADHWLPARWTRQADASLASHRMLPQWIDGFRREAFAQQLDRHGATAADIATVENTAGSPHIFQRHLAPRAKQLGTATQVHFSKAPKFTLR
jgi:hypothetical protein